ncbi:TPA: hypothetical protein J0587_004674 [Salmonella enterica subsp. enterica serovar Kentucky]|nr:hypothetical protein [Salmonella enterica subsp. enterica serovar Kentucky]
MTGREIVINYFKNHKSGTLQQICDSHRSPFAVYAKVSCALHDMRVREEVKLSGKVYEIEESIGVDNIKVKPLTIRCHSYVPKQHFGGNNYLTQLLRAVRG